MIELHFPWLEVALIVPLLAALWIRRQKNPQKSRQQCIAALAVSFLMTAGAWVDFSLQQVSLIATSPPGHVGSALLEVDELNAPLLPVTSLLFLLTAVATLPTKVRRFSFAWSLLRSSVVLAAFACKDPWAIILFLTLSSVPVWMEIAARGHSTRVFGLYVSLFLGCIVSGQALVSFTPDHSLGETVGIGLLVVAVLIRCGMFPFIPGCRTCSPGPHLGPPCCM